VRDDGGVEAGAEVSIYYDPMISKLAAWGSTRAEAIDRLRRALDEYSVGGIKTTLPFFREIVRDREFIEGRLDTGFISRFFARRDSESSANEPDEAETLRRDMALIAAALSYEDFIKNASRQPETEQQPTSQWKLMGRAALHQSRR
jgi:acetyl-CoA carboxylase biotin carboxylase subunit